MTDYVFTYDASVRLTTIAEAVARRGLEIYDIEPLEDGKLKIYCQKQGGPQRWRGIVEEMLDTEGD